MTGVGAASVEHVDRLIAGVATPEITPLTLPWPAAGRAHGRRSGTPPHGLVWPAPDTIRRVVAVDVDESTDATLLYQLLDGGDGVVDTVLDIRVTIADPGRVHMHIHPHRSQRGSHRESAPVPTGPVRTPIDPSSGAVHPKPRSTPHLLTIGQANGGADVIAVPSLRQIIQVR